MRRHVNPVAQAGHEHVGAFGGEGGRELRNRGVCRNSEARGLGLGEEDAGVKGTRGKSLEGDAGLAAGAAVQEGVVDGRRAAETRWGG